MPDQKTVRLGFVGAGLMAQHAHMVHYWNRTGVEMAALAEGRSATARLVADRYGFGQVYPHHRAMLADARIDSVIAILPFELNGEVVEDVLRADLPVLTEKPQVMTSARGRELVELAHRHDVHYHVGYMKRFDPGVAWAKQTLARWLRSPEAFGTLQSLRLWCAHGLWDWNRPPHLNAGDPLPDYASRVEEKPDWMCDAGWKVLWRWTNYQSHQTSLARYLIGEDYKIDVVKRVGDSYFVQNTFNKSGAQLYFDFSSLTHDDWDEGFEAVFERAKLTAKLPAPLAERQSAQVLAYENPVEGEPKYTRPSLPGIDGFRKQAEHFVALVRGEVEPASPASEAVKEVEYAENLVRTCQQQGIIG